MRTAPRAPSVAATTRRHLPPDLRERAARAILPNLVVVLMVFQQLKETTLKAV